MLSKDIYSELEFNKLLLIDYEKLRNEWNNPIQEVE